MDASFVSGLLAQKQRLTQVCLAALAVYSPDSLTQSVVRRSSSAAAKLSCVRRDWIFTPLSIFGRTSQTISHLNSWPTEMIRVYGESSLSLDSRTSLDMTTDVMAGLKKLKCPLPASRNLI